MKVDETEFTPALYNDPELTRKTVALFKEVLGEERVSERPPIMGGEDFCAYGRAGVPIFFYFLGTVPPEKYEASKKEVAPPIADTPDRPRHGSSGSRWSASRSSRSTCSAASP